MRKYLVLTPEFDHMELVNEYGGPVYSVRDFVEIVAKNKTDAVALGVQHMLRHRYADGQRYEYVHDQRSDNRCPYTGVRAYSGKELKEKQL